eukprot:1446096-Alexandrium_andersonii.AAC.1
MREPAASTGGPARPAEGWRPRIQPTTPPKEALGGRTTGPLEPAVPGGRLAIGTAKREGPDW